MASLQEKCVNQTLQLSSNSSQIITPPYTPEESLARTIAYICILIPALFLNTVVIICFYKDCELRCTFNLFILNMAITDLMTAIFRMGFNVFTIATIRGWIWPYSWGLCQLNGYLQGIVQTSNMLTLLLMAVFRYIAVVQSKRHLVTNLSVLCAIGISWILSMIEPLLPIIGWNRYIYNALEIACFPDWLYEKGFPIFIMLLIFAIPLLVMAYCYSSIYWTIKKNSKRVRTMSGSGLSKAALLKIAHREAKVTRTMFIIFATFLICFGPYVVCITILFPLFSIWVGKDVAFFCGWMANFNSVVNPIIYPFLNDRFKKSYHDLFCQCCNQQTHAFPNNTSVINIKFTTGRKINNIDCHTHFKSNKLCPVGNSDTESFPTHPESDLIYNDIDD